MHWDMFWNNLKNRKVGMISKDLIITLKDDEPLWTCSLHLDVSEIFPLVKQFPLGI